MSYVLNYSGVTVPANNRYATVSGKDNKRYMYRVNDMMDSEKRIAVIYSVDTRGQTENNYIILGLKNKSSSQKELSYNASR
ncbi:hypothetical protein ACFFJN_10855 [Erwinia mallotivora]|uniref:hypothetical protein n=1 Tax=Erwinia mallotivora TaxID=69222 RepID=UPI0035ED0564